MAPDTDTIDPDTGTEDTLTLRPRRRHLSHMTTLALDSGARPTVEIAERVATDALDHFARHLNLDCEMRSPGADDPADAVLVLTLTDDDTETRREHLRFLAEILDARYGVTVTTDPAAGELTIHGDATPAPEQAAATDD